MESIYGLLVSIMRVLEFTRRLNMLRQNYKLHRRNDNLLLNGQEDWNDEAEYCDEPDDSTNSSSLATTGGAGWVF